MVNVLHVFSVFQTSVHCLSTVENIQSPRCVEARYLAETKLAREYARKKEREAVVPIAQEN